MKTAKWVLLAGMVLMLFTMGCDKLMTSTNPQPNGGARTALDPLGMVYNPSGSWFLYFVGDVGVYPGSEHLISIGQDNGATNSYVMIWKNATDDTVFAEFHMTGNWYIQEAHFDVATTKDGLAHNKSGNLTPGKFKGQTQNSIPYPQTTLVAVPWTGPWTDLYMAALCKVAQGDTNEYGEWYYWNWNTGCGGDRERPPKDHLNLPTDTVTVNFRKYLHMATDRSYWDVTLSGIGDGYNLWDGHWVGWCADRFKTMPAALETTDLRVRLWSCYDGALPPIYQHAKWDEVSWMINEYSDDNYAHQPYFLFHFNNAVYYLLGQYPSIAAIPTVSPDHKDTSDMGQVMARAADSAGVGYHPEEPGDWYAVICDLVDHQDVAQPIFIEVDP